ncbi:thiol-activated cytolysin family protein [Ferruginibacter sp. HRS2-29]|uniref:thiol-activated cytolysin family protein n=1 Tax=Ferruginibacter sp. HRS2-29 TaxID=2487334 RepID=UPI0020CBD4C5|nr:thiol-activated cytolysin family protein [Ferruginibacter sp. HRS2-29]MCP9751368.1 hypothetical protein [Ferruginibacter sp. HRS2-29]
MKPLVFLPLLLACSIASAQLKKSTKVLTNPKVTPKVQVVEPPKKNGVGSADLSKAKVGELNAGAARALGYINPMVTTLNGQKISTVIVPLDQVRATNKAGDRKTKPKDKGTTEDNGLICKNYSVSLSPESESFDAPLADKMTFTYPGAAYNYNDYIKNNVQPPHNRSPRNPIILQVSSSSGNGKQVLVQDPTRNNLDEEVGKLKYALPRQANNLSTEIYVQTIVNEASFALNVEAGGGGYGFKASAKFGLNYDSRKTYMSIDAKQKNYVITANLPDRADSGFYKDPAENAKNENVYMSSVTYGRRVIGIIETELDQEHMEVGVKASYDGFGVSANLGLGIVDKMSRGKTTVRLLFIGGNGEVITIPNPTAASVQATINQWMTNTSAQAAVPIEYTFKNMRNIGMRWESVASNINYQQCVPKPPAAAAPQPWDITVTLNSISNNKREGVKLGISQSVGIQANGTWKNENSGNDKPIICWMQDWSGCQVPPEIDFKQPYRVGTTRKYTISNDEYESNPIFRVDTKRIVTYRTSIGGSTNDNTKVPKYDVRLKDMESVSSFDVPANINGRIFSFNYTVKIMQRPPTQ